MAIAPEADHTHRPTPPYKNSFTPPCKGDLPGGLRERSEARGAAFKVAPTLLPIASPPQGTHKKKKQQKKPVQLNILHAYVIQRATFTDHEKQVHLNSGGVIK